MAYYHEPYIDNIPFSAQGLYCTEIPAIPVRSKRMNSYTVLNRDGKLYEDTGYFDDLTLKLKVAYVSDNEAVWHWQDRHLRDYFLDAEKLSFTDDLDYFWKIKQVTLSDNSRAMKRASSFTATFTLDPYQYMSAGCNFLTKSAHYKYNPGEQCFPDFECTGPGTLTVNGNKLTVSSSKTMIIDTRAEEVRFSDGSIANKYTSGDISKLVLVPGNNTISFTGKLRVRPNWRK